MGKDELKKLLRLCKAVQTNRQIYIDIPENMHTHKQTDRQTSVPTFVKYYFPFPLRNS